MLLCLNTLIKDVGDDKNKSLHRFRYDTLSWTQYDIANSLWEKIYASSAGEDDDWTPFQVKSFVSGFYNNPVVLYAGIDLSREFWIVLYILGVTADALLDHIPY